MAAPGLRTSASLSGSSTPAPKEKRARFWRARPSYATQRYAWLPATVVIAVEHVGDAVAVAIAPRALSVVVAIVPVRDAVAVTVAVRPVGLLAIGDAVAVAIPATRHVTP